MASRASARSTCAEAESRDCVTCCSLPRRAGTLLLEPGEACVLQLGQREGGPGRLQSGAGLVDPLLDLILGVLERLLGLDPVGQGGGGGPPGDLDLDRDLLADEIEVGTLAVQLGERRIELGPRDVDLVAVRDRVDLRHDLPLDDAVVLIGQEPDDPAGDQLRGDVDDVGLDKGVIGDRVAAAVFDPARSRARTRRQRATAIAATRARRRPGTEPASAIGGRSRRGRGRGSGSGCSEEPGPIGWRS